MRDRNDTIMPDSKEAQSNRSYLEKIENLSFADVEWTRERIFEVRDFLSPWSHNIRLPYDVYTASCASFYPSHREIVTLVNEVWEGAFQGKRLIDIGCLEGYFSVECALQGAEVLGVEGKEINLKKCEFVRSALGVPNLRFVKDDALEVTHEKYGSFDAILALGLLYHLDDPYTFLKNMRDLSDGFLLIDTIVATEEDPQVFGDGWRPTLSSMTTFEFGGREYPGKRYEEFAEGTSQAVKDLSPTASLNTDWAVWLTRESLVEMLKEVGFEQVVEHLYPPSENIWWRSRSRVLLVASSRRTPFLSKVFGY